MKRNIGIILIVAGIFLRADSFNGGGGGGGSITINGVSCTVGGSCTLSGSTLISDQLLVGAAPSVTFSSIPGTYKNLILTGQARGDAAQATLAANLTFNGDGGTNYEYANVNSNVSSNSTAQTSFALSIVDGSTMTSAFAGGFQALIPNYAGTTFQKTIVSHNGGRLATTPTPYTSTITGTWFPASPAAITSITITASTGNFVAGSRFSLWGEG